MSDYIVQVKIKNGPLLRAMRRRGLFRGSDLARAANVSPTSVSAYLSLKYPAMKKDGDWRPDVIKIADALHTMPEDLFPPQHIEAPLARNTGEIEASFSDLTRLDTASAWLSSPEDDLVAADIRKALAGAMDKLTDRERFVLELRFGTSGQECTLDDVAGKIDITRERVRQIEKKALRKLRHPSLRQRLEDAGSEYVS